MDRNIGLTYDGLIASASLSARRAWIEMYQCRVARLATSAVALRKESVDRNLSSVSDSLPALVALRKESVDRNSCGGACVKRLARRSPQGERG